MKIVRSVYNVVGWISERTGRAACWIVVIIIGITAYDVFMRYVLNRPTVWAWTSGYMLGACFVALGLAYTHYHRGNVRVDVIYSRFSPRLKLIIDIFFSVLFFFPLIFMLTAVFIQNAWFAYSTSEFDHQSIWYPLTWPFKTLVAVGFILLFFQGAVLFLKDVMALIKGGNEPW